MGKRQTSQRHKKKNTKQKRPSFTSFCNGVRHTVRAKGAEQAAMKVFRMNKSVHAERGFVEVFNESNESYRYPTSNWCCGASPRKFISKPKK
mmetsp:Transcript_24665/g.36172  ORF Transcript_24665/g.36172 Transcript_24665/m.36172 type:complete len:92 (+) Transcript_24665:116-391(+)